MVAVKQTVEWGIPNSVSYRDYAGGSLAVAAGSFAAACVLASVRRNTRGLRRHRVLNPKRGDGPWLGDQIEKLLVDLQMSAAVRAELRDEELRDEELRDELLAQEATNKLIACEAERELVRQTLADTSVMGDSITEATRKAEEAAKEAASVAQKEAAVLKAVEEQRDKLLASEAERDRMTQALAEATRQGDVKAEAAREADEAARQAASVAQREAAARKEIDELRDKLLASEAEQKEQSKADEQVRRKAVLESQARVRASQEEMTSLRASHEQQEVSWKENSEEMLVQIRTLEALAAQKSKEMQQLEESMLSLKDLARLGWKRVSSALPGQDQISEEVEAFRESMERLKLVDGRGGVSSYSALSKVDRAWAEEET